MVGAEAEHRELSRRCAFFRACLSMVPKLVSQVNPHLVLVLRNGLRGFDPNFIFSWTRTMGVMEGDSAVQAVFGVTVKK